MRLPTTTPGARAGEIGSTETQAILGISNSLFHTLVTRGKLRARMHDKRGEGCRRWLVKRTDVLKLQAEGGFRARKVRPKIQKILWERYFGTIPRGYKPIFRDGSFRNVAPNNLCLVARKTLWRPEARGQRRQKKKAKAWTLEQLAKLRREYSSRVTADLAREFGKSASSVRMKARRLKLRKTTELIREQIRERHGAMLPVGTERTRYLKDGLDIVYVKIANRGKPNDIWRPKHHLIWEKANGKPVPDGHWVVFADGNRRNFDPSNLMSMTRPEASAFTNARFYALPRKLQKIITLSRKLKAEADRQVTGGSAKNTKGRRTRRPARNRTLWTPEMDRVLRRDFADKTRPEIASTLRVTVDAVRHRARRLHLQRPLETVMREAREAGLTRLARDRQKSHPRRTQRKVEIRV